MSYSLSTSALMAATFSLTVIGPILADTLNWIPGGGGSCIDACKKASTGTIIQEAVVSGQYKNLPAQDQSFTVCRSEDKKIANRSGDEDGRIGFNIVSSGAQCRFAYGN